MDKTYAQSTCVCDLSEIPVPDCTFDAVVLTQVMEHLPEPLVVLKELSRVLRLDGALFVSGPFFYEEHEVPYDFFRYTQYGARYLLGRAGFAIERIGWLEGYACTVGYQLETMAKHLPRHPRCYGGGLTGIAASAVALPISLLGRWSAKTLYRADTVNRITNTGFPKNYFALAGKQ